MEKKKKAEVIRAAIFNLKRDRDFWKRRAEANVIQIVSKIKELLYDKDRDTIRKDKLKGVLLCERSELDKLIVISVRVSDLFETIGDIKDESKLWRKANDISNRLHKLENQQHY